jgi:hypothetical protein
MTLEAHMTNDAQNDAKDDAKDSGSSNPTAPSPGQAITARNDAAIITRTGYMLNLRDHGSADVLTVAAPDGQLCLRVVLGPDGPMVEVQAASLRLTASADIRVDCERLELNARERMTLRGGEVRAVADRDFRVQAGGLIESEAFAQTHRARLGNIELKANDDVALDGEQIRLNSPKPTQAPVSWPNLGPVDEQPPEHHALPESKVR